MEKHNGFFQKQDYKTQLSYLVRAWYLPAVAADTTRSTILTTIHRVFIYLSKLSPLDDTKSKLLSRLLTEKYAYEYMCKYLELRILHWV